MVSCEKHDYGSMKESCCPICLNEQTNLATNTIINAGKLSSPVEPEVSDDFGGEPLKLNGEDLDKFIELIEIMNDTKYLTLHNKLLKKKLEIVTNISQNSR